MTAALETSVGRALRTRVLSLAPVRGGDANDAYRARLADGRDAFVKTSARASVDVFASEADGLAWLKAGQAIRTPVVLAVLDAPAALVLEWIEPGRPARGSEAALGRALASLHRQGPASFGLDGPGWLAGIPWDNTPSASWATFYAEQRLVPMLERAARAGRASERMRRGIEALARGIQDHVGPAEPPARLHGDLWSGNLLWDAAGSPVLVDPAAYGGHREVDLAMMQLFGGFSRATFDAYGEAHPLAHGHAARVPLYQLLPLLAHVVLFGGSYVASVERALAALGV